MKLLKNMLININKITLIQIYIVILLLGIIFHLIKHINRYLNFNPFFYFKPKLFRGKNIEGLESESESEPESEPEHEYEPICKEIKHSVDVNEFEKCDSNTRAIIKSKLLNETDYGGITIPSGFEDNIDWCTNDILRYKIKDINKPSGKCFKKIIEYVEDKCWKYYDDNITTEDESIKADAQEAKDLADEFGKIKNKKTSTKECGLLYDPNADLT